MFTCQHAPRETSYPSGTAQNEQQNKPNTAAVLQGYQINDVIWRALNAKVFVMHELRA